jgi:copper chaperone CopZ
MAHFSAHAPDIECDGCAASIRRSLARVKGVTTVEVDVQRKIVDVEYDPAEIEEAGLSERLATAGFPTGRG